ncbi:MAG: homocysteine S-methyltransferase family protein [Acutalibacteraceae bacterium]
MTLKEYMKNNVLILDGGMGTLLQKAGLRPGELPERWNTLHPEIIENIHKAYYDSGSNVVLSNTFGANILKFSREELEEIICRAVENAENAKKKSVSDKEKFIALDIGPCGKMLKPYGELDFEDAVSLFAETVKIGVKCGVDLIFIETMNSSYETKAALLAAKENSSLPVFVSNAYGEDGKLLSGTSPAAMVAMLEGMGADAIGCNCSLGPKQLSGVVGELLRCASVPVIMKPNAGLPVVIDGKTCYDVTKDEFADEVISKVKDGVCIVGGCCGTTPEYISALSQKLENIKVKEVTFKNDTIVSSYSHAVSLENPVLIGERVNPTGKKRFQQALRENDMSYILSQGLAQQDAGAHILDINVGLPDIDEKEMLVSVVSGMQSVSSLPLQIDTSDPAAMEAALRIYDGKAMINSVSGKKESMDSVFPLVKKYGGVTVALTLDENGIPQTAQGRFSIAEKILREAQKYGINKKDIVFDTLTMAVSADKNAAKVTLDALKMIRDRLGCKTVLGVSNISFGLPQRDFLNSSFFTLALNNGLKAAIMNPNSKEMMKAYRSYLAISGLDDGFSEYIAFADAEEPALKADTKTDMNLQKAILKGLKDEAAQKAKEMLETVAPLDIIQNEIIPALDEVGKGFEEKKVYLPQLLMSAESAKLAFEEIKKAFPSGSGGSKKCTVIIATVKGDIHDIGKNIVRLLLENYGFDVIDLGKDVPPEAIVAKAKETNAPLVGLSALMTTTVPAMEETIRLLKEECPHCKTVVGGAVLTQEYAAKIGADAYSKDAMETVRYAEKICEV